MHRAVTSAVALLAFHVVLAGVLFAESPASNDKAPQAAVNPTQNLQIALEREGPVAVPEPSEKAMRYYRSGNVLWVVQNLWGLLVPLALLFTGASARMRDLARRIGRKWLFAVVIYTVMLIVVLFVADLPLAYYSEFVWQHAYGLSNQTFSKWATDSVKSLAVSCIVFAVVVTGIYFFLKKSPRRWWLWAGLASVPFIILMLLVAPIWIAPLFNKFGPMTDKSLEADILALADHAGIEGGRVFEVDKSVDTNALNAYVTGFGGTKRIVLWDTIIAKLDRRELLFVMGHEMGHYVLSHIYQLIALFSVVMLLSFYAAHRVAGAVMGRWHRRIGFAALADIASLPLVLCLVGVFSLLVTPLTLAHSRWIERQSDRFGLEITRDNHAAATAFVKLQTENLGNPRPGWLYKLWRSSHPPLGERIDFCNNYRPWETGQMLSYEHLFKERDERSQRSTPDRERTDSH